MCRCTSLKVGQDIGSFDQWIEAQEIPQPPDRSPTISISIDLSPQQQQLRTPQQRHPGHTYLA